jgi:hypothetical protein
MIVPEGQTTKTRYFTGILGGVRRFFSLFALLFFANDFLKNENSLTSKKAPTEEAARQRHGITLAHSKYKLLFLGSARMRRLVGVAIRRLLILRLLVNEN